MSAQIRPHALTRAPKAGGAAPDTDLTPQALAEMSEERFAEVLNEQQARGDEQKLMQFVWSLIATTTFVPRFVLYYCQIRKPG